MLKAVHEVEDMDGEVDNPVSSQEAWPCPRGETGTCERIIVWLYVSDT